MKALKKIIFIVGPTSVGKTEVAVHLAKRMKGEIISCDSMQVYKEINIANNKPFPKTLKVVPHHMVNVVSVNQEFDVAAFNKKALAAIKMVQKKKKVPIIVGGSGLYMGILLDGIFKEGEKDIKLREDLQTMAMEKGELFLYQKLIDTDPLAAAKIHPHDIKRVIRSLEVCMKNQRPISELQKERSGLWGRYDISIFALNRERTELYERIDRRVDQMFEEGLVDEIKLLTKSKLSQTAERIIGVRELAGYLEGAYGLERAQYLIKLNSRHYAKRQLTWLRKEKRLTWIMIENEDQASQIAGKIEAMLKMGKKQNSEG